MGNISGVTIPTSKDNIINSATNSTDNNSYNTNLTDAYDFYYESEDMYIPETQEEINENNTNLQDEITNLTNTNNELETEKKRIETLKENFDYDEELRTKYELNEDAAGRIMNPSEYEKREKLDNSLYYTNPDGSFNEELFQERLADYTDRYNKALNESTNGEFTDIDILSERMSELNLNIASNNESIRLKTKEQQEAEYDNKALTDCFKDNMNNETNYKDKMTESEQGYEYCKDIVLCMKDIGNQNDAEDHFKELTGKELCAYDLLECLAEEKYGISPEQLRTMTAEEAEEFIRNLQGDGYNWANQAYGIYKYLNDKQLAMIKTIGEEDGLFESRKYYECIEEKITSLQGMEDAIGFFNDLLKDSGYDLDDVRILVNQEGELEVYTLDENGEYSKNYDLTTNFNTVLRSFGEGVGDGVVGFFDGLANAISTNGNKSRIDYKKLYIAYFLSNNVVLKGSYDVGNGVGNLLPSIAANALIGFAGVPAALQSNLGYIMLGISAYGGAKHEYEVKGMTGSKVIVGAIFKGLLEYLTGKMFGRIPWLNEEATLALSEYMKTGSNIFTSLEWGKLLGAIADNMVHEGMEEFIQSYFEEGIDCAVTGEKYEIKETTKEALYSFLIGALTSGVLSGSNVAIDFTFNGIEYKMNQQEIEDFLSKVESTKEITALNIFTTMKKYNCSVEIAQTILEQNLNEEQAKKLIESLNQNNQQQKEKLNTVSYEEFIEEIENIKNITEEELPDGFDSVEIYKRTFIDSLIENNTEAALNNNLIYELCKDAIMLDELLKKTDRVERLLVENYKANKVNSNIELLENIPLESMLNLLNRQEMKDYINNLSPIELAKLVNNLTDIYETKANTHSTIIDKICTFTAKELEEFGIYYLSLRLTDVPDLLELLNGSNTPILTLFEGTDNPQSIENIRKLCNHLKTNIYTEENMIEISSNIISQLLPIFYFEDQNIDKILSELRVEEDRLKYLLLQKIENASNVELEIDFFKNLNYKTEEKKFIDITVEIDGKEIIYTVPTYSEEYDIYKFIISDDKLKEALRNDKLKIKSIEINELLSKMILTEEDGLQKGINYVRYKVDGKEYEDTINFSKPYYLSSKFPGVEEFELISVEPVGEMVISLTEQDADDFYEIKYTDNGEEKIAYVTPKTTIDGEIYINVGDFIEANGLFGVKLENIEVNKVERPDIDMSSIKDLSSFNEIFSETVFGGNQSDVNNLVKEYIDKPIDFPTTVGQIKAKQLVDMIKATFPNATEMDIINIADAYTEGGCYYMAIANAFAAYMGNLENGEEIFLEKLGFDLKTTANGETSYNLEAIALDIFLRMAQKITKGDISKIQNAIGVALGSETATFINYFAEKGIKVSFSNLNTSDSKDLFSQLLAQIISNPESIHILTGSKFDLDLYNDASSINSSDDALSTAERNGEQMNNIGGHAMIITDANENEIHVSTWGQEAKLADRNFKPGKNPSLQIGSFKFEVQ